MDEQKQPDDNEPKTAPILDVKPPESVSPVPAPNEVVQPNPVAPDAAEEPHDSTPEPASPAGVVSGTPAVTGIPNAPDPVKQPELTPPKKKQGAPVMVIVAAVVIAAILAAVTILAFNKDTKKSTTNNQSASQEAVDAKTIDDTTKEIDDSITQLDEAKDFPDAELTDQTLGL